MIFNIIYYYIKHKTFPRFSSTLAMFTHAQAITFAVDIPFHCDLFLILMFFLGCEDVRQEKDKRL